MLVVSRLRTTVTNPGYFNLWCQYSEFEYLTERRFVILWIIASVPAIQIMKPTVVADEMFPEGAGPYMDLEEVPC